MKRAICWHWADNVINVDGSKETDEDIYNDNDTNTCVLGPAIWRRKNSFCQFLWYILVSTDVINVDGS